MASYEELGTLFSNDVLKSRVTAATWIAAIGVQEEDPGTANHANRLRWADTVFGNPLAVGQRMLIALLVDNKDNTEAQILAASDATIQTKVDAKVNDFANGIL